jgi:anti-sigma factor RsiW
MKCREALEASAEHLAACPECAAAVEEFRAQARRIASAPRHAAPADAWARLDTATRPVSRARRWTRWAAAAAAAAVTFGLGALILTPPPPPKHFDVVVRLEPDAFDADEIQALLGDASPEARR